MEHTREIVEISSDDDETIELRIPEETRGQQGVKKEGDFCRRNNLPAGDSLNVSDDDDCLILEGVSESAATCSEYTELGGELLDEMLIVGEKGQFACRDYPHPRYLCATFLFSMTPHKKHCDLCHCYVCDSPAPCKYWESHCNSTHKEITWRAERQSLRRRKREQLRAHKFPHAKPYLAFPTASVSNSAPTKDETKPFHHQGSIQCSHVKPAFPGLNQPVSKSNDEPQLVRRRSYREPPSLSTEAASPRPKDILCEIYKICPTVISCRRRIPPSLQPDELSDTDHDH
ncbi:hypothetical protein KSP39_PZI013529 [Platanthera zijinensis]|uniref:Uncharacterized protein n=1 Tax=Platanthera zijinensis TaxID=2320716 RepID=A0AAP0G3K4_9ASPA